MNEKIKKNSRQGERGWQEKKGDGEEGGKEGGRETTIAAPRTETLFERLSRFQSFVTEKRGAGHAAGPGPREWREGKSDHIHWQVSSGRGISIHAIFYT